MFGNIVDYDQVKVTSLVRTCNSRLRVKGICFVWLGIDTELLKRNQVSVNVREPNFCGFANYYTILITEKL